MNDEQLEEVAGGSVSETNQMHKALGEIYEFEGFEEYNQQKVLFYVPIDEVGDYLKKHFNIDSKMNFRIYDPSDHGFVTEGKANEYSRNGKSLTHQQVLDIISGK